MTRTQETIINSILISLAIIGALNMDKPQPFVCTFTWSICFAFATSLLFMHMLAHNATFDLKFLDKAMQELGANRLPAGSLTRWR